MSFFTVYQHPNNKSNILFSYCPKDLRWSPGEDDIESPAYWRIVMMFTKDTEPSLRKKLSLENCFLVVNVVLEHCLYELKKKERKYIYSHFSGKPLILQLAHKQMTTKLWTAPGLLGILPQFVRDFLASTHPELISTTALARTVRRGVSSNPSIVTTQSIKCK